MPAARRAERRIEHLIEQQCSIDRDARDLTIAVSVNDRLSGRRLDLREIATAVEAVADGLDGRADSLCLRRRTAERVIRPLRAAAGICHARETSDPIRTLIVLERDRLIRIDDRGHAIQYVIGVVRGLAAR